MTKLKPIREVIAKKDGLDLQGIKIRKGIRLFVMKEGMKAPFGDHHKVLVVKVDNGTGILDLMPETAVRNTDIGVD